MCRDEGVCAHSVYGPPLYADNTMTFGIHTGQALRKTGQLAALALGVYRANADVSETHWLEWKTDLDFGSAAGRFALARTILGFANRDPVEAARDCGGEAYVLVGVEPGTLTDVKYFDPAVLYQKLKHYVEGPFWAPEYVEVEGKRVLVVSVGPPSPGDRIHTLVNTYNNAKSGTVFYRGPGLTEPADHRQMIMLQNRLVEPRPETPTERLKNSVSSGQIIEVADLVEGAVTGVINAVTDTARFPVTFADRTPVGALKEVIAAAEQYGAVLTPLFEVISVGCRWGRPKHDRIWTDAITRLSEPRRPGQRVASTIDLPAGPVQMLTTYDGRLHSLSVLPATLTLYAGTIAALDGDNYGAIRALTTDAMVSASVDTAVSTKVPVITMIGPWDAIPDEIDIVGLRAAQTEPELPDHLLARIASGEFRKRRFAWSTYLFNVLDGTVGRHRYAELFDKAETLFSLILVDLMLHHRQPFVQPWLGRFVDSESWRFEDSQAGRFLSAAVTQGSAWPPLVAGLFGGQADRARVAVEYLVPEIREASRRGPT